MSQQINLFNPIFLKQEKHFSAMTMAQGLGIILLGALLLTAYTSFQLSKLQSDEASVANQLQLAQNQLAKVTAAYATKEKDSGLEARLQHKQAEVQSLQQVADLLEKGEFGNTGGYADFMTAFARQIGNGIWLTGFTIQGTGSDIAIKGNALRPELVPIYLSRLKTEAVMQGASFATLEMQLPKLDSKQGADTKQISAVTLPYIEFNLHSSGIKEQDQTGGQAK